MLDPHATLTVSVSHSLVRNKHFSKLMEVYRPLGVHHLFLQQILVLLLGCSTSPSGSTCITALLPVSPLCSWNFAGRHSKSLCDVWMYELWKVGLPVPHHTTSSEKNTKLETNQPGMIKSFSGHYLKTHSIFFRLFCCCLSIVPTVLSHLSLSFPPKKVKLIHDHFLTGLISLNLIDLL